MGSRRATSEVDSAQRISSSGTVLTRQFYDGQGHLVETRSAAPGGEDTVQYTLYNVMGQASQQSGSYFVAAYTGAGGVAAAFSIPDTSQAVMVATYDGLGRMLSAQDQLGETTTESYGIVCNAPGTNDSGCYEQTLAMDANHHQTGTLADGFGRQIYAQRYSGSSAPYTLYSTELTKYDTSGRVVQQTHADGSQTTDTYNADGTLASSSDPDQGTMSYSYDANGNQTQQVDARGATGTTYTGYDGLNRPVWRNTSNNASGAYVTYSYDAGMAGSYGTGRLTAEVFRGSSGTSATPFSGAYTYTYDALGRTIRSDQTMGGAGACPSGWTCQDIGYSSPAGGQNAAGDGIWTLQASGSDVYGTSDGLHLVSEALSGDGSVSAHFDSQTVTGTYTKMGVMLRSSNAANAAEYNVQVDANGQYYVVYRSSAGGSTTNLTQGSLTAPVWLQVSRSGSSYSAYWSKDGTHWTYVPNSTISLSLGSSVLAGVFASANNASAVSIATLDSVSVTTGGTGACPSGWTCQDIGSPTPAGTQNYLGNGVWSVIGGGADIWGSSDQFHYVSQALAGDATVVAHVGGQTNSNNAAKAGLMFRAGTAANAAFYFLTVTPGSGQTIGALYRATTGGSVSMPATTSGNAPVWLKVTRSGTTFSAYTSSDGQSWTALAGSTETLSSLSGTIQVGIAVTSHNTSATSMVTLDSVSPAWPTPSGATTTSPSPPSGVTSYATQQSYDDAGAPTNTVYPDGEMVATSYTGQDWLAGLSTTLNGTTTTLLSNVSYSGTGGAAREMTGRGRASPTGCTARRSRTTRWRGRPRPV